MENNNNNLELKISGIKCDNPSCGFKDMSVLFEDYPQYINKPCPCCGENLLTKKDYKKCLRMMKVVNFLNKIPMKSNEEVEPVSVSIEFPHKK